MGKGAAGGLEVRDFPPLMPVQVRPRAPTSHVVLNATGANADLKALRWSIANLPIFLLDRQFLCLTGVNRRSTPLLKQFVNAAFCDMRCRSKRFGNF